MEEEGGMRRSKRGIALGRFALAQGGAALFSPEGIANLMIAAVLVLGAIAARR